MKTKIEVYDKKLPYIVICSGMWNTRLSASEVRKRTAELTRNVDRSQYDVRIEYIEESNK